MKISKNDVLFILSLLSAIWFALLAWIWVYLAALIFAYPIGILSFILWLLIRKENKKRTKIIPIVLSIGLAFSLGVLGYWMIFERA